MLVLAAAAGPAAAQPAGRAPAPPAPPASDPACAAPALASALDDEGLYDAGVCHEQAGSLSAAIAAFDELRTAYPRSPLAGPALLRTGRLRARAAQYREAAEAFEEYARRYPAERDAEQALIDAIAYRRGTGNDDQAIDDTRLYVRAYGARRPAEAAAATFALGAVYEQRGKPDELLAHLRDYLKTYGAKGGGDRVVIAYSRIGQLLWEQSCKVKTIDGACVKLDRPHPVQCGAASRRPITVVRRDPRKVKEAMAAFAAAIASYEKASGRFPGGDERAARHHYALARFGQAEVDYEAYLALAVPAKLDFDPARPAVARTSGKRFSDWLTEKQRLGARTSAAYSSLVTDVKDPAAAVAAAARLGLLSESFSDALFTVEVPASFRGQPDAVAAYCGALTDVAEPLEAQAIEAFAACLRVSTEAAWVEPWSPLCERELGVLRPDEFPAASELRPVRPPTAAPAAVEPAIDSIP